MEHLTWSPAEKRIARAVFDRALEAELADLVAEFKRRAADVRRADDMWPLGKWLAREQRAVDEKYDYRYSELPYVFARLVREGRINEDELLGLADDKRELIRRVLAVQRSVDPLTPA